MIERIVYGTTPEPAQVLQWSTWRRQRQFLARSCHYRARGHDPTVLKIQL